MLLLRLIHLTRLRQSFASAFRLMQSPRVPLRLKLIAAVLALLFLSPLNPLGDIPLLGVFDDAVLFGILASWFVRAASRHDLGAPNVGAPKLLP
jgi:uncharacterized membrane protein YkvA (DUF1232 family)